MVKNLCSVIILLHRAVFSLYRPCRRYKKLPHGNPIVRKERGKRKKYHHSSKVKVYKNKMSFCQETQRVCPMFKNMFNSAISMEKIKSNGGLFLKASENKYVT